MNPKQHQWTCGIAVVVSLVLIILVCFQIMSLLREFVDRNKSTHNQSQNIQTRQDASELLSGVNCNIDRRAAERLYREAYENGDKLAGLHLGNLLRNEGDRRPHQEEFDEIWRNCEFVLQKLVREGSIEASYLYARAYINSDDPGIVDYREYSCDFAALAGFTPAYSLYGAMHEHGLVSKPDLDTAHYWFTKAKEAGSTTGISGLGRLYTNEEFSDYNPAKGIILLQEGSERGDRFAALGLGEVYEQGIGVEPDYQLARENYLKAEALGLPRATVSLARMNIEGLGQETDIDAARKLLAKVEHLEYLEEEVSELRNLIDVLESK